MPHCHCQSIWQQPQLNVVGSREQCMAAVEAAVDSRQLLEAEVPTSAGPFPPGIVVAYTCTACQQSWLLELPDRASGSWRPFGRDAALSS